MEKGRKSIGAMWLKTGKTGAKFMSGNIEIDGKKHGFVVFKNKHKETENQPDYVILPQIDNYKKKEIETKNVQVKDYDDVPEDSIPF